VLPETSTNGLISLSCLPPVVPEGSQTRGRIGEGHGNYDGMRQLPRGCQLDRSGVFLETSTNELTLLSYLSPAFLEAS
jgi:hypothetical protein